MIKALTFLGILLAGLPVGAQTVTDAPSLAVIDLILENGCSVSNEEAAQIFPAAGFTRNQVRGIARDLMQIGLLQEQNGRLVLQDARCNVGGAGLPPLVPFQEQFVSILRHNGCQFQGAELEYLFPRYGMDMNLAAELEEGLVDGGIATVENGVLSIGPEFCIPDEAFAALPQLALTAEEQHLVEILETGSCTLLQSEIEISFPQDSMTPEAAQAAVDSLLASGVAMAVRGGDRIWVSSEKCQPWSERNN